MPPQGAVPPIELDPNLEPVYANLVRIAHTPAELVFDFARLLPGDTSARVHARLVMSPVGAKLLFRALSENLARYEAAFGEINLPGDNTLINELFRQQHTPENHPQD
jgi:hypothetical protein